MNQFFHKAISLTTEKLNMLFCFKTRQICHIFYEIQYFQVLQNVVQNDNMNLLGHQC